MCICARTHIHKQVIHGNAESTGFENCLERGRLLRGSGLQSFGPDYYYYCLPFKKEKGRKIIAMLLLNEKINMPGMLCQGVMRFAGIVTKQD